MSGLKQLEKWADDNDGWFSVRRFWVHLESFGSSEIIVYRCPSEMRDYHDEFGRRPVVALVAGTDNEPASLDAMTEMALQKWQELHGSP